MVEVRIRLCDTKKRGITAIARRSDLSRDHTRQGVSHNSSARAYSEASLFFGCFDALQEIQQLGIVLIV